MIGLIAFYADGTRYGTTKARDPGVEDRGAHVAAPYTSADQARHVLYQDEVRTLKHHGNMLAKRALNDKGWRIKLNCYRESSDSSGVFFLQSGGSIRSGPKICVLIGYRI